jgi:hypothetical protein
MILNQNPSCTEEETICSNSLVVKSKFPVSLYAYRTAYGLGTQSSGSTRDNYISLRHHDKAGPTHPPNQWLLRPLSVWGKGEADRSVLSSLPIKI